ncbi:Interferon lambda-4 [Galemys pyrenaicus]|uniref:Interferon lambda-4 n=1 Tax=Galemys pyrenaicus TaxID=202257 RepID=A0A8J6DKE1_GALPY|nr:Interferon lambda-4 [Galemys pyrenaicus]
MATVRDGERLLVSPSWALLRPVYTPSRHRPELTTPPLSLGHADEKRGGRLCSPHIGQGLEPECSLLSLELCLRTPERWRGPRRTVYGHSVKKPVLKHSAWRVTGAEMGCTGGAALALGVCMLVMVGVEADPDMQAPPRRCLLSHYRWLDPQALVAVKALKDRYEEERLSSMPRNCPFRARRNPPPPSSCLQLLLVARGIAQAQAVLSSLQNSSSGPFPGTGPTLALLAAIRRDVSACLELGRPGSSRKFLRTPRRRLKAKRHRAEPPGCREATIIFSLLRLLTWDLRLVAHSGPCL